MKILFSVLFCLLIYSNIIAQTYTPTKENIAARTNFQDNKFGMFIHWGLFSIPSDGEWAMNIRNITVKNYTRLQKFFNPIDFNAEQWVSIAKNAGMKYITLITRHHDGFSMWETKFSDFNIMNTPYHKDVVKLLADECHKQNIKLFLYYSLLDWRRDDYSYWTGNTGHGKLSQALDYGAVTCQLRTDFDGCLRLLQELVLRAPVYQLNSINPFRLEGQKTLL